MRAPRPLVALALVAIAGGGGAAACAAAAPSATPAAAKPRLTSWPEFGLNPQRSGARDDATGITAANVSSLALRTVALPGTADNSAIYLHGATVHGRRHNVIVASTTYGITVAIDVGSGRILWRFAPRGLARWQGSPQITTAAPIADPSDRYVYSTSPNGLVHKLALENGHEARGWPVRVTPAPHTEKLTAALGIADGELLATTGGYFGDPPPYVGHIVAISLATGHVDHTFNTLCANRHGIIHPRSCSASDSAILSRGGPVVEPGGRRVLIATGNAPFNGTTNFGDSVIELTLPDLRFRQAYTPTDTQKLNSSDTDLGSGTPALLPGKLVLDGGKDGTLRVLRLSSLDGAGLGRPVRLGGEVQTLPTPGGAELWCAPAVWHDLVFVADSGGTAAYRIAGGRLHQIWQNGNHGTSPVLAGGLLYVYDMDGGGIRVYRPRSGRQVAMLPTPSGHWNSPIVVDGHVIEPVGNANDHATSGQLLIFSAR